MKLVNLLYSPCFLEADETIEVSSQFKSRSMVQFIKLVFLDIIHPLKVYRLAKDIESVRGCALFDVNFYLKNYPELIHSIYSPIRHYCQLGWREGRNPSSLFDTNEYLSIYPDVKKADINPLVHFIKEGRTEGRYYEEYRYFISEFIPPESYFSSNPEFSPGQRAAPEVTENIEISIVLLASRQQDSTRACLNSLLQSLDPVFPSYEIHLVVAGSTSSHDNVTDDYPGINVIPFVSDIEIQKKINSIIKLTKGRFILFVGSNLIALPNFLPALNQLVKMDDNTVIIGPKILYSDGTIKEAGNILWKDGSSSPCIIGRTDGHRPHRKQLLYDYVREVDSVSIECYLVRKQFLEVVGGVDEDYDSQFYRLCDLAMAARSKGMRVLYQPKSEVVNTSKKSTNLAETAVTQGNALANDINRLREKWRNELASAYLPPDCSIFEGMLNAQRTPSSASIKRRTDGRLNILYFSTAPSHPDSHGNQATIQQFGRRFKSMGHNVNFVLFRNVEDVSNSVIDEMRDCWDSLDIIPHRNPLDIVEDGIPFDQWYEEGLGERICMLCDKYDADVVFCTYIFESKLLDFIPSYILKIIDTHDKMGNRYDMLRANGQPLEAFSCTPEDEGAYLRRADLVVARRSEEATYFDSVSGRSNAIVIPHFEDPKFIDKQFTQLIHIGIVASNNLINLAIVKDFLNSLYRRINGESCPFTIHIAGQVNEWIHKLPQQDVLLFKQTWVKLYGFVPDISKFYQGMDVVVSPVTMGTGINVKTVQAMAFGTPLISTQWGSKGIETDHPMHKHKDMDGLVDSLFSLREHPDELNRLAQLSRDRYLMFYKESMETMKGMFEHPKIKGTSNNRFRSCFDTLSTNGTD